MFLHLHGLLYTCMVRFAPALSLLNKIAILGKKFCMDHPDRQHRNGILKIDLVPNEEGGGQTG